MISLQRRRSSCSLQAEVRFPVPRILRYLTGVNTFFTINFDVQHDRKLKYKFKDDIGAKKKKFLFSSSRNALSCTNLQYLKCSASVTGQ